MSDVRSGENGSDSDLMNDLTYEEFLEHMISGSIIMPKIHNFGVGLAELMVTSGDLMEKGGNNSNG